MGRPSLMAVAVAALVCCGASADALKAYQAFDVYDAASFFDKFDFFVSRFDTASAADIDPTHGYLNYRSRDDAKNLGLISTQGSEVFLGVNHASHFSNTSRVGRDSVRIESKALYTHGLFIWDFTHTPAPACGLWPAAWMFGDPWPHKGEIDIYEAYNLQKSNMVTLHADNSSIVGSCTLAATQPGVVTSNCDTTFSNPPAQYTNQGCGLTEPAGTFNQPNGAIYAMEWTSDHISVWSFTHDKAPGDLSLGKPDPTGWGVPSFHLANSTCNIDKVLYDQKLVLNLAFCGDLAGNQEIWNNNGCRAATGFNTCVDYVAASPDAYADAFFKIASIKVYKNVDLPSTTTSKLAPATTYSATSATTSITTSKPAAATTSTTTSKSTATSKPTSTTAYSATSAATSSTTSSTNSHITAATTSSHSTTTSASSTVAGNSNSTSSTASASAHSSAALSGSTSTYSRTTTSRVTTSTASASVHSSAAPSSSTSSYPTGSATSHVTTSTASASKHSSAALSSSTSTYPTGSSHVTTSTPHSSSSAHSYPNHETSTATILITSTYTVSKCAPTVTNCPIGKVTSEVQTSTKVWLHSTKKCSSATSKPSGSPAGESSKTYPTASGSPAGGSSKPCPTSSGASAGESSKSHPTSSNLPAGESPKSYPTSSGHPVGESPKPYSISSDHPAGESPKPYPSSPDYPGSPGYPAGESKPKPSATPSESPAVEYVTATVAPAPSSSNYPGKKPYGKGSGETYGSSPAGTGYAPLGTGAAHCYGSGCKTVVVSRGAKDGVSLALVVGAALLALAL